MTEEKQLHPVDKLLQDIQKLKNDAEDDGQESQLETVTDTVRYGIIPVLQDFSKLWMTGVRHQNNVNQRQMEAYGGMAGKLSELETSITTLSSRLDDIESGDDDYDTRITQEHAETLTAFVRASMGIASKALVPGEEQQAFMLRGQEILAMIEANTLVEMEDDDDADNDD